MLRILRPSLVLTLTSALLWSACSEPEATDPTPDGGERNPDGAPDGALGELGPIKEGGWKNTVDFPDDPFLVNAFDGAPKWVKLVIDPQRPTTIYFQDSNAYAFHYDFARTHWDALASITPAEFESITLRADGQRLITGAVLFPGKEGVTEAGIEIIRRDPYAKEDVQRYFEPIRAAIRAAEGIDVRTFYFPTPDQRAAAERDATWLAERGIEIGSIERWLDQDSCYAPGWAYGKWVYVPRNEIHAAFLDGRLKSDDILLTDAVPAEVPRVAAIVTLTPATPNSHVAILAKTFGIPFVFAREPAMREKLQALVGEEALLRTTQINLDFGGDACKVQAFQAHDLSAEGRAELLSLKAPRPVQIDVKDGSGPLTADTAQLRPNDIKRFGGKASNFGSLRRAIPNNSPSAMGISFALWDAFMAQPTANGGSLKSEIAARLAPFHEPVTDVAALEAKLGEIRALVEATSIPEAQRAPLLRALQDFGFVPTKKLKFRSSTNVEDGAELSGAGLYDSYSGCLADDLDADDTGPSRCDADSNKEKGALAAIVKVFRSFYNTGAVLERIRYGLTEDRVGMAMVVNKSFPDDEEAANGVATFSLTSWGGLVGTMVSQLGAESITNPDGSSLPEVAHLNCWTETDCTVSFSQGSSRVPLGGRVLSAAEYQAFAGLFRSAGAQFLNDLQLANRDAAVIDVEYKKTTDGALSVKQIRLVPRSTERTTPFYFDVPTPMCVYAQEQVDLLGTHRTKASLSLGLANRLFDAGNEARGMVRRLDGAVRSDSATQTLQGPVSAFPGVAFGARAQDEVQVPTVSWRETNGQRTVSLVRASGFPSPILLPEDLLLESRLVYDTPRPFFDPMAEAPRTRDDDTTTLAPCTRVEPNGAELVVELDGLRGIHVKTTFKLTQPEGPFEKTTPLARFVSTTITGWIAEPITLTGELAQTGIPAHHNFSYSFVFEPALDPNLSAAQRAAIEATGITAVIGEGDPLGGMTGRNLLILNDGRLVTE